MGQGALLKRQADCKFRLHFCDRHSSDHGDRSNQKSHTTSSASPQYLNIMRSRPYARRRTVGVVKYVIIAVTFATGMITMQRIQDTYLQSNILDPFHKDFPVLLMPSSKSRRRTQTAHAHAPDIPTTCLQHAPLHIQNVSNVKVSSNETTSLLTHPSSLTCGRLRRNWTYHPVRSPLAKVLEAHQNNCSL
jgi:hypothetical protein